MSEVVTEPTVVEEKVVASPFSESSWKTEATATEPVVDVVKDVVAEEKSVVEEKIVAEKPVVEEKPVIEEKIVDEKPKFANEESEKIYNLLHSGEADKALEIYSEQKRLKEADKLPPADAIKLSLQYQNKDFTPAEIQDLFEETYSFPEKPVQGDLEDDDDFKIREDKYSASLERLNRRIDRDAKPAIAELTKLSKEIVLPEIQREQPKQAEPTQEELEATQKAMDIFFEDLNKGAESFTGYNTTFKDEEVEIKANIPVTQKEKEALAPILKAAYNDISSMFTQLGWANEDGKVTGKLVEDLHLILNKEAVLSKVASEIGNKRMAEAKKSIKNIDYSGKQQSNGDLGQTPQEKGKAMVNHFFSS